MTQDKRFPPTPKRLRDARRRGEVAHSADVSSTAAYVTLVTSLALGSGTLFEAFHHLWLRTSAVEVFRQPEVHLPVLLQLAGLTVLAIGATIAFISAAAAALGSFVQVGTLVAVQRLAPNAQHLDPAAGFRRVFSTRSLINLAKVLVKMVLLGVLMTAVIRGQLDAATRLGHLEPAGLLQAASHILLMALGWAAVVYVLMAAMDFVHQRYEFVKRNRMSFEDLKREHEETEGNAQVRGRRKATHWREVFDTPADRLRLSTLVVHARTDLVALQFVAADRLPRVTLVVRGGAVVDVLREAGAQGLYAEFDPRLTARIIDDTPEGETVDASLGSAMKALLARGLQTGGDRNEGDHAGHAPEDS